MSESERHVLIDQAVAGDGDALQRLIMHYHDALNRTVGASMNAALRRHLDPEDVLQQAYVSAFRSVRDCRFDGPGAFYKWLERIAIEAVHEARRNLRRRKRDIRREVHGGRRARAADTTYIDLVSRLPADQSTPSRQLARREAAAAALSSLARLTDDQRAVVRMRFLENRPVAEIAAELGRSEDAVYMLCHRGLKALQGMLGTMSGFVSRG